MYMGRYHKIPRSSTGMVIKSGQVGHDDSLKFFDNAKETYTLLYNTQIYTNHTIHPTISIPGNRDPNHPTLPRHRHRQNRFQPWPSTLEPHRQTPRPPPQQASASGAPPPRRPHPAAASLSVHRRPLPPRARADSVSELLQVPRPPLLVRELRVGSLSAAGRGQRPVRMTASRPPLRAGSVLVREQRRIPMRASPLLPEGLVLATSPASRLLLLVLVLGRLRHLLPLLPRLVSYLFLNIICNTSLVWLVLCI